MTSSINRGLLIAAGVCGFTAVLAGTFGAHGIKGNVSEKLLANFETGVHYHLAHALALLGVAILSGMLPNAKGLRFAGWCMVFGIIVFSGSLYVMAVTGKTWLGMITPFGGVSFLVAWALVAITAFNLRADTTETRRP